MKPSVTKLIDLLDKPALLRWANKLGLDGVKLDDYRSKEKEQGSNTHESIENYLKFKILPDDKVLSDRIELFFIDKEVLEIEKSIETEFFIGRFDVKLKWKDFVFICDFKNSDRVYLETKLQLSAYKMAESCDHVAVINTDTFMIRPVDTNEIHIEFIKTLSKLYDLKYRLENSK